ncbi:MAG: GntR family transcriptional regulator [Acidimicrobiales bacterium]
MIVHLDDTSQVPPWQQLVDQIGDLIAGGTMPIGHRLPAIRQLARDLDLAPGTVARSYRELEATGVIETRGRHGSFVLRAPERRDDRVGAVIAAAAEQLQRLGVTADEAARLLAASWPAPPATA